MFASRTGQSIEASHLTIIKRVELFMDKKIAQDLKGLHRQIALLNTSKEFKELHALAADLALKYPFHL